MQCSLPLALRLKISQLSAGSIAASIQSGIGNAAAESACTALQSAGMYRALNAIGVTAGTVSTAAGAVALGEFWPEQPESFQDNKEDTSEEF